MNKIEEFPVFNKKWNKKQKKLAIVYPNEKYGGVYNLGILVVYNLVNNKDNWVCERRFIDNSTDLGNFDLVGFSWQYEMDLYSIIDLIEKNGLKCSGKVFIGGPCVNNNFRPLQDYADFFVVGYAEKIIEEILDKFDSFGKNESGKFLKEISKIGGVFVPKISNTQSFALVDSESMNKDYPIFQPLPVHLDKRYVFGNCFLLEVERGCPFKCKFCPLGKRQVVYRDFDFIKEVIDSGIVVNNRKKVVIYTASFTHPKRKEILKYLISKNLEFSVPSIKAEYVDQELLDLIKKGGQRTLTIAPECGETLRSSLNKSMKDLGFIEFVKMANKSGFKDIKLYFMIGLPGQDLKDCDEIVSLVSSMQKTFSGKIYVSINPLMPKANTEFANVEVDKKKISELEKYLRSKLHVRTKYASVEGAVKCWRIALAGIKFPVSEILKNKEIILRSSKEDFE